MKLGHAAFGLFLLVGILMSGCINQDSDRAEPVSSPTDEGVVNYSTSEYSLNFSASEHLRTRFVPSLRNDTICLVLSGPSFESNHTQYLHEGCLRIFVDGEVVTKDVNFSVERDYVTYLHINVTCNTTRKRILYYEGKYRDCDDSEWMNGLCSMILNERYMTKPGKPEITYYSRTLHRPRM